MHLLIRSTVCALLLLPRLAQADSVLFVGVENDQIVAGKVGEHYATLTEGPARRRLPVRSKDGGRIAYIQDSPDQSALAMLVVIEANGRYRASWPVAHIEPGEIRGGMRFVEELEWIDADRIAVSGSINPSTIDYEIIRVTDGTVTGLVADAAGAAFSPDGAHAAYVTGAPHFGGARAPVLTIDELAAAAPFPSDIDEAGRPIWSQDGRSLALLAHRPAEPVWIIAIAQLNHASALPQPHALPFPGKAAAFWNESTLYVRSEADETYAWRTGAWERVARGKPPADAQAEGAALLKQLTAQQSGDFWCAQCALSWLPRRSPGTRE